MKYLPENLKLSKMFLGLWVLLSVVSQFNCFCNGTCMSGLLAVGIEPQNSGSKSLNSATWVKRLLFVSKSWSRLINLCVGQSPEAVREPHSVSVGYSWRSDIGGQKLSDQPQTFQLNLRPFSRKPGVNLWLRKEIAQNVKFCFILETRGNSVEILGSSEIQTDRHRRKPKNQLIRWWAVMTAANLLLTAMNACR